MGTQVKFRHLRENENMAKKLKTEKSSILQNFRTAFDEAVKKMSFKLGLRQVHLGLKEEKIRWPSVGSNFSSIPELFEIPETNNPAPLVSSKTQKDSKPIKN